MSKAAQSKVVGEGLSLLKRQFEQWRCGRVIGQRIPAYLWDGAVSAVAEHGVCRASAELHLDYAVLKRRVALAGGVPVSTALAPRFVEVFAPAVPTTVPTKSAPSRTECVVEMDNARGAKMRAKLSGHGLGSLSALCSAFLGAP